MTISIPREKDAKGDVLADSLFQLARTPSTEVGKVVGTQDEIMFAIKDANAKDPRFQPGGAWAHVQFSADVEAAVQKRYLQLASVNFEHFANPSGPGSGGPSSGNRNSAGGTYRALHEAAIDSAHEAKARGESVEQAMAHEAAAEHFLTDAFAAGHIRTPRKAIAEYWGAVYPLFFENFKKAIAQDVAIYINAQESNIATALGSVLDIENTVLAEVDEKAKSVPPVGFDAVVSALAHDVDNKNGLLVTNDLGDRWKTFGDSHGFVVSQANPDEADTKKYVERAVSLSVTDIQHAFDADPTLHGGELQAAVKAKTSGPAKANQAKYGAEQLMPRPDPAGSGANGDQNWKRPDFQSLWTTPVTTSTADTYGTLIKQSVDAGDIDQQLSGFAEKFPESENTHWSTLHPKAAFRSGFMAQFKASPRDKIQRIIDFDPAPGQNSSRDDDATRADLERLERQGTAEQVAGKPGADSKSEIRGLTFNARVEYVKNLFSPHGWTTSHIEGERIYELFETAKPQERRRLYEAIEKHAWSGSFDRESDALWSNLERDQLDRLAALLTQANTP